MVVDTDTSAANLAVPEGSAERCCLACGYNLHGLGEAPRCPECGLLHVPSALREQVWQLVDAGTWFLSGMFTPWRKRPPGWWWALDRPGDVKRSFRFAGWCALAMSVIVIGATVLADSVVVEADLLVRVWPIANNQVVGAPQTYSSGEVSRAGLGNIDREGPSRMSRRYARPLTFYTAGSCRIAVQAPSFLAWRIGVGVAVLLLCMWAVPLWVGLMTQLRPELPAFARAPRTIVAAGNYEAHRLLHSAAGCVFVVAADVLIRIATKASWPPEGMLMLDFLLLLGVCGCAALGWIGPVRSDYTHQLVRTRGHATRIVIMYGFFLGPAMGVIFLGVVTGVILLTVQ